MRLRTKELQAALMAALAWAAGCGAAAAGALTPAQQRILAAPGVDAPENRFSFDDPAGPQFTGEQQQAQREAGARVVPMVAEACRSGAESVRIPPGDYRFGKEHWDRNGAIYALEFADLVRDEQHPFTIDASGATFWFDLGEEQAPKAHFCLGFRRCANVVFQGATLDRGTRGNVEGRITQFDFEKNRIELQLSPGVTLPAALSQGMEQRVLPFKADGSFCAPLYALQSGGVHLKYLSLTPGETGRVWVAMADKALLERVRDPKWLAAHGEQGVLRVGDGLSCVHSTALALSLVACAHMTMLDLRILVTKGLPSEEGGFGAHLWKNCYLGPRPGTSRWQGGEGFMFNATRHGTTLDHVTITHTADDILNIHGYWSLVESAEGNRVRFTKARGHRLRPPDLEIGDRAWFLDRNTGALLGRAEVTAIETNAVTCDTPVAGFGNAIVEWPDHECAGWLAQDCQWRDDYQRVLIQSGPGTLRRCALTRTGSWVELNTDFPYVEGGIPRDIAIEDNQFVAVGAGMPASVGVHVSTFDRHPASLLGPVRVAGNTFDRPQAGALRLDGVSECVIENNRFVEGHGKE